ERVYFLPEAFSGRDYRFFAQNWLISRFSRSIHLYHCKRELGIIWNTSPRFRISAGSGPFIAGKCPLSTSYPVARFTLLPVSLSPNHSAPTKSADYSAHSVLGSSARFALSLGHGTRPLTISRASGSRPLLPS